MTHRPTPRLRPTAPLAAALCAALALTLVTLGPAARAADPGPPAAKTDKPADKPADPLAAARSHIAAKRWDAALDELRRVNATGNADWNNLMGYTLRKGPAHDYAAAAQHYDAALRIDPMHRGALEYSGELALITGQLPQAEQRLATLERACRASCGEYADLKQAVARFKAAGNRYVE